MIRVCLILCLVSCVHSLWAQGEQTLKKESLKVLTEKVEVGKTYALLRAKSSSKSKSYYEPQSYYLKLVPPKYRRIKDTVVMTPALNTDYDTTNYFIQTEVLVLKDPNSEWKTAKVAQVCLEDVPALALCLLKELPEYRIVNRRVFPFKNVLDTAGAKNVTKPVLMEYFRYELISDGRIEAYKSRSAADIQPGEKLVRIPAGRWKDWQEVVCPFGVFNGPSLDDVQRFLRKKGYTKVPINNTLDHRTLEAINDFQRKNGLEVGALTPATYRKMGFEEEKLIVIEP